MDGYVDSPSRQSVPAFGSWRSSAPGTPVIDYTDVFSRARASRLGCIPAEEYAESEYGYPQDDEPVFVSERRSVTRQQSRKNFFQYFVCGARAPALA